MAKDQYKEIDPILDKWLPKFGLIVSKEYHKEAVRSISVIDDSGLSYHIWIEWSKKDESFTVKAHWSLRKKINRKLVAKNWDEVSTTEQLLDTLDKAYEEVNRWIISNGNTRHWTK